MALASIAIFVLLATLIHGAPIQTPESQQNASNGDTPNVVPGVFISADTLKDLQSKAQQNLPENENLSRGQKSEANIAPEGDIVTPNSLMAQGIQQPSANLQYQQQPMLANQGPIYQQQQPQYMNQQPQNMNQQPQFMNQQPQNMNQQPQFMNQQPQNMNQQPQYVNQQPQYQQPQYVNQQPQFQQPYQQQVANNPGLEQQPMMYTNQPLNQPQYAIGQQALLPNQQQPIYQHPIGNQLTLVYPNGQQPIRNQPTLVYQNGQPLVAQNTQPISNQPTLIYPTNQVQNQQVLPTQPGNLFTLVPVNNGLMQQTPNQAPIYNGK